MVNRNLRMDYFHIFGHFTLKDNFESTVFVWNKKYAMFNSYIKKDPSITEVTEESFMFGLI